jgi:hypothetical protein
MMLSGKMMARWLAVAGGLLGSAWGQLTTRDLNDDLKVLHWVHIPKAGVSERRSRG